MTWGGSTQRTPQSCLLRCQKAKPLTSAWPSANKSTSQCLWTSSRSSTSQCASSCSTSSAFVDIQGCALKISSKKVIASSRKILRSNAWSAELISLTRCLNLPSCLRSSKGGFWSLTAKTMAVWSIWIGGFWKTRLETRTATLWAQVVLRLPMKQLTLWCLLNLLTWHLRLSMPQTIALCRSIITLNKVRFQSLTRPEAWQTILWSTVPTEARPQVWHSLNNLSSIWTFVSLKTWT